jgi:3-phenylpropionate/trans-cinnamate dioxygenase ferredoxin subunit
MSDWIEVADQAAIAPGKWAQIDVDGTLIAVFNVGGEFLAIEDICTHDGAVLSSVRTGVALTPPAWEPIATFPCKIEDGKVYVRDDRWD